MVDTATVNELFTITNTFISSNHLLENEEDRHIHKKIIDDVFEFREIGKPFTSAVINMLLEMEIGQTIHIPLYEDEVFHLYKIHRDMNKFQFEDVEVTNAVSELMQTGDEPEIPTEFEDALGQVSPIVIQRIIDMLNHMILKLNPGVSMGGTGGTSRKIIKRKTRSKRKTKRKSMRKNKH